MNKQRLKILYIASSGGWGGASVALYNLIIEVSKEHEVHVLFPRAKGRFYDMVTALHGVHTHHINYGLTIYSKSKNYLRRVAHFLIHLLLTNTIAKCKLNRLLLTIRPDIVHNNVGPLDISSTVCKRLSIPHVWHMREYQDLDFNISIFPSKRVFTRKISDSSNYNIAITEDVFQHHNLRTETDVVIYDGVFAQDLKASIAEKRGKKYILFVGRLEKAKCPEIAICAFAAFHKQCADYQLWLAGNDKVPYAEQCRQLVKDFGIESDVKFLGERSDVYGLMANATLQIVPSRFEGFGFITAEAMYNRCLVIGHNTAGTREQLNVGLRQTGEEIGLRFNTEEELVEQLIKATSQDFSEMKERAYSVVTSNYTAKIHADRVINYYHKVLTRSTKKR